MLLQTSTFVHPQLAVAALGLAVLPVLIHLINRGRYRRERWAAMGFLLAASRRTSRRIRLEQGLLLLVRIMLVVALGLAVARPFVPALPVASLGQNRTHHILLIDNSCSMWALILKGDGARGMVSPPPLEGMGHPRGGGGLRSTRFDEAMGVCEELVGSFPGGDAVSLVTLAWPAGPVIGHAAYDRRIVREELGAIELTQRSTDVVGGLGAALEILYQSEFPPGNRVVYVIGDTPASTWLDGAGGARSAIDLARRVSDEASLVFLDVGSSASANVAVTDVRLTSAVAGGELPVRVFAEVSNFSDRTVRGLHLQVSVDDRIVRSVPIEPLGPYSQRTAGMSLAMGSPGSRAVRVSVEPPPDDALSIDNSRLAAIDVLESLPVLLVDGHPGASPLAGNAGYLSTALSPGTEAGDRPMFRPRTISHRELPFEPLEECGVIALCNVPRLDPDDWQRLEEFVGGGGGLLVFVGDRVEAGNYNEYGYRDGAGVLPCRLGDPTGDADSHDQFVRLVPASSAHPALADFSGDTSSGLFVARVHRFWEVEPSPDRADVLMHYTDGHPALVIQTVGRGRSALVTTSANMSWTNLPAKGDYVSLVVSLVTHLAPSRGSERTLAVGDWISEPLGAGESSYPLRVTDPDGEVAEASLVLSSGSYSLRYGPIEGAGTYRASIGPRQVTYVSNIDPGESDLRRADEKALADALGCEFTYVQGSELHRLTAVRAAASEIGGLLLYLVLILLVVETWLARKLGAYH